MTPPTKDARVPRLPVNEAKAAADEAGVPDYMAELAIFQVLLNHPKLACALNDLLATMLWRGMLDSAVTRTGHHAHRLAHRQRIRMDTALAGGAGPRGSADDLLGVRDWQAYQAFGPAERAVLAATDDVVRDGAVSAESWSACQREFGADPAVLVELVTAIGAWRMVASILHSLQVPLEDGVASWPPDGQPPDGEPNRGVKKP